MNQQEQERQQRLDQRKCSDLTDPSPWGVCDLIGLDFKLILCRSKPGKEMWRKVCVGNALREFNSEGCVSLVIALLEIVVNKDEETVRVLVNSANFEQGYLIYAAVEYDPVRLTKLLDYIRTVDLAPSSKQLQAELALVYESTWTFEHVEES